MEHTAPLVIAERVYRVMQMGDRHYFITLPYAWVNAQKVGKGNAVKIKFLSNGCLLIEKWASAPPPAPATAAPPGEKGGSP